MNTLKQILQSTTFETIEVLRALNSAHRLLGELKGKCLTIPNQSMLLNTLILQEAQDSSSIENIITTQDELFKYRLQQNDKNTAAKEVHQYNEALHFLFTEYQKNKLITNKMLVDAQQIIIGNNAGIRKQKGTELKNAITGKVIYTPPDPTEILTLLQELEQFINDNAMANLDPIIKMAIIHHQFESIHPFYDGNGRIGRLINIIYLVKEGLLELPVLYLSRYINHNKSDYYRLLQEVREKNSWQEWILYIVKGVEKTADSTITMIEQIKELQQSYKTLIRNNHAKIYSQDLINNLFQYPYTKISFLQKDLDVSRPTASRYLETLTESELLIRQKFGKENYYINPKLVAILSNVNSLANDK